MFYNTEDSISVEQKPNVISMITYLGRFQKYVGKTNNQPMHQHLSNCSAFNDHIMLFTLPDAATNTTIVSKKLHLHNAAINKTLSPEINFGLKASKEQQLFK